MRIFLIAVLISTCLAAKLDKNLEYEQNLTKTLWASYNKNLRPSICVDVGIDLVLKQITSVEEKSQVMTTSSFMFLHWTDTRLSWNPKDYNNIESILVQAKILWLPDIFITNSVDNGFLPITDSNMIRLNSTGEVFLVSSLNGLKTKCEMDAKKFPFETQNCKIKIGSWQYEVSKLNLISEIMDNYTLDGYTKNPIWNLTSFNITTEIVTTRTPFIVWGAALAEGTYEEFGNEDLIVTLTIKRRSVNYLINNIYPPLILNIVTLAAFVLPFSSQVSICLSMFLTLAVFSLRISGDMPISITLPYISLYFLLQMLYIFFSLIWFLIANHFATNKLPKILKIFSGYLRQLGRIICCKKAKEPIKVKPVEEKPVDEKAITESSNCNKCEKCLESKLKDDIKKKEKDELSLDVSALNMFIFSIFLILNLISNSLIWNLILS